METSIRWPLFILGCGALVLAVACTSASDNLAPATTAVSGQPAAQETLPAGHPTVDPSVQDLPVEALLGETDLGPDWAQGDHQVDPLAPTDSYYCGKQLPSMPWTQVAQFANTNTSDMLVQILSKFPDVSTAQTAMQHERQATNGCTTWSSSTGANQVDWTIQSVQTLDIGDEAFAEKSSTQAGDPAQRAYDFAVMVRKGAVVILLDQGGTDDNDGTATIAIARKALDKLNATVAGVSPTATLSVTSPATTPSPPSPTATP